MGTENHGKMATEWGYNWYNSPNQYEKHMVVHQEKHMVSYGLICLINDV